MSMINVSPADWPALATLINESKLVTTMPSPLRYDPTAGVLTVPDAIASQVEALMTPANWRTLSAQKLLTNYAATARYAKETGGITVSGIAVPTDRQTQQQLTGAAAAVNGNSSASVQWKLANGSFVTLTAAQIATIAAAVFAHVQACFAAEASAVASIGSGAITNAEQVDAVFAGVSI